jgi:hypothetical protein
MTMRRIVAGINLIAPEIPILKGKAKWRTMEPEDKVVVLRFPNNCTQARGRGSARRWSTSTDWPIAGTKRMQKTEVSGRWI